MIHMCMLTLKIFELIQWNVSRIDFFIEVTPSKVLQIWGILKWKSFSTLNKGQNKNYMTQLQTKNECQKKHEWWEWTWKKILWKDMPNMPKDFEYDCGASLRKQNRIIFLALTKAEGSVAHAYCQCLAGRVEP